MSNTSLLSITLIRQLRVGHTPKLPQHIVASAVGMKRAMYSLVESRRKGTRLMNARKIAAYFGRTIEELFDEDGLAKVATQEGDCNAE